jgi:hypothetical protein
MIDRLKADLCICIGVDSEYNYDNPFYKLAKYKFLYHEISEDYSIPFDDAYKILSFNRPKYEKLENVNGLYGKIAKSSHSTLGDKIKYRGIYPNISNFDDFNNDEMIVHYLGTKDNKRGNQVYSTNDIDRLHLLQDDNVVTYKKPLYWREFLKIKNQWLGGIKDDTHQHPGSAAYLIYYRWLLLKRLIEMDLINQYDRFIITRSDYIYQLPHPQLNLMNENFIWIPNGEHYSGYTDRHAVLSKHNIKEYLGIFNSLVLRSNEYFMKLRTLERSTRYKVLNLEMVIKAHFELNNLSVKEFPYVMYTVRSKAGKSKASFGQYSKELGYFIKYRSEFRSSNYFKAEFEKFKNITKDSSEVTIDDFYEFHIDSTHH